jgi:hypothetical protein
MPRRRAAVDCGAGACWVAWCVMLAKSAAVVAVLLSGVSVGALTAVGAADEPQPGSSGVGLQTQADCEVGGSPTRPYGDRPPEPFLRYRTRPVVIGCAELASGRRFELIGYQLGRGERSSLCVDQYDFETDVTWGCGSNLVRGGGAIDATSREHTAEHVPVVAGTTAPSVARVVVRSEVDGRLRGHPVALVNVRDRELLRTIGVRKAFGRYLAEVPSGARAASAEALGFRGRRLGLAFFPGFRGPVGEGRTCYSRPRVARLRLLDPARVDKTSRLRIVATYPGGYIGSIDVRVAGSSGAHADLVEPNPRRAGGRRVVTLPVTFTRRGTVGVDVTAEGVPLSRRCGARPLPRHSAPKTLVTRVQ